MYKNMEKRMRYADHSTPVTNWMKLEELDHGVFRIHINAEKLPLEVPEVPEVIGKLLLVMGDINLPVAMALSSIYSNRFGAIALLQGERYIIVVSHDPKYKVGEEKSHCEIFER